MQAFICSWLLLPETADCFAVVRVLPVSNELQSDQDISLIVMPL